MKRVKAAMHVSSQDERASVHGLGRLLVANPVSSDIGVVCEIRIRIHYMVRRWSTGLPDA